MEIMRKISYEVEKTTQRVCELLESESEELIFKLQNEFRPKLSKLS